MAKAIQADVFVFLDDVQFHKGGFQNRTLLPGANGDFYLTIPVKKAPLHQTIREVSVSYLTDWPRKHARSIEQVVGADLGRQMLSQCLDGIQETQPSLGSLTTATCKWMLAKIGYAGKTLLASDLDVAGSKQDRIVRICRAVGADTYISGLGAAAYQDSTTFARAGIDLMYIHRRPPDEANGASISSDPYSALGDVLQHGPELQRRLLEAFELKGTP